MSITGALSSYQGLAPAREAHQGKKFYTGDQVNAYATAGLVTGGAGPVLWDGSASVGTGIVYTATDGEFKCTQQGVYAVTIQYESASAGAGTIAIEKSETNGASFGAVNGGTVSFTQNVSTGVTRHMLMGENFIVRAYVDAATTAAAAPAKNAMTVTRIA